MQVCQNHLNKKGVIPAELYFTNNKSNLMKKMKFLGLLLAFSFIFVHFTQAQTTTLTRVTGTATGTVVGGMCSNFSCMSWPYATPGSFVFSMIPNEILTLDFQYGAGVFSISRAAVDALGGGVYTQSNGTNSILIWRVSFGIYRFSVI